MVYNTVYQQSYFVYTPKIVHFVIVNNFVPVESNVQNTQIHNHLLIFYQDLVPLEELSQGQLSSMNL